VKAPQSHQSPTQEGRSLCSFFFLFPRLDLLANPLQDHATDYLPGPYFCDASGFDVSVGFGHHGIRHPTENCDQGELTNWRASGGQADSSIPNLAYMKVATKAPAVECLVGLLSTPKMWKGTS
jgi:hypothetical protein